MLNVNPSSRPSLADIIGSEWVQPNITVNERVIA